MSTVNPCLDLESRIPMPLVWRFASTALIAAFAMLLLTPLAVVELAASGVPPMWVGGFAFIAPLTMTVLLLMLARVTHAVGRVWPVRVAAASGALAALGFATTEPGALWALWMVLVGVQFAVHWASVDTVISENVPPGRAGATIGLYQTLLAAAVALGPVVASVSGWALADLAGASFALMLLSLALSFGGLRGPIDSRRPVERPPGLWRFIAAHPALLLVAFLAGLFEVGTTAMGSVQALGLGFSAGQAVLVASVIAIGSLVAQVPIGRIADRFGAVPMMRLSAAVLVVAALALWLAPLAPWLLWPLAVVWGAFGGGLQTLVYLHVAISQRGSGVVLGMATMALGFTLGTLVGPALGGVAVQASPRHGFALLLGTMALAVLMVVMRRRAFAVGPDGAAD